MSKDIIIEINQEIIKAWNRDFPEKKENFHVDPSRLDEALELVKQSEDPVAQAIFLMAGISWAQPFSGANKRTAYISADTLLKMKRYRFRISSKKDKDSLIGLLNEIQTHRSELDHIILMKLSLYVMKRVTKI